MEAAVAIVGLLFVLFVLAGVFVTVKAVTAAKRGVDRTVAQARRTVEDTSLRARQLAQPGVVGELAQLRLSLRMSMRATQEALRGGSSDDASLSEAIGLFERLSAHGHELDDELKRLEREPDRATIAARLPELRERTERITHSAESLRWAARDRARKFADDDLAALSDQIDVEAGALRHWTRVEDAADPLREPVQPPVDGASGARAADGAPDDGVRTGRPSASEGGHPAGQVPEGPQALTARDPRTQPSYPWEKAPRTRTSRPSRAPRTEGTTNGGHDQVRP
ncbi:hypothetical protein SAMN05428945_3058 [Streptomyces sp. 2224.1]|uniref:hypothetical protein n=1 Tax=unclassified Streptomyces TaxID=2593676 RepID=UPI000887EDBE|nr:MULTISPECIES: hypothetical protein [unclassified Streptomyces]PBC82363.1 hypothetical protein BX261_2254 [Streptomyces sp. 2321.6]SDR50050.1 hypothetical protein SAMN05216511_4952 [Streptomyces sp. KS_16]SEC49464.1 hypothetical protein SAMN05428945_3058 [Streptomyces sp. 2224.1]SEC54732.1 hypothetical protein SAMN05428940_2256 [Streptomyces sp. 2133.1]SEE98485.1 hypothetical protein SAMN05428954_5008 [Streptomyces sp. 2112.3]